MASQRRSKEAEPDQKEKAKNGEGEKRDKDELGTASKVRTAACEGKEGKTQNEDDDEQKKVQDDAYKLLVPESECSVLSPVTKDFTKDNRYKWANRVMEKASMRNILKEFRDHKDWKPESFSTTVCKKNADKNRYGDIMCFDQTRVVLKDRPPEKNYIHASWMPMPNGFKYISTQGPLKETLEDFWHMIYTEKVNVIVMLCLWNEGNKEKCRRYYHKDRTEKYGDYSVRVKQAQTEPFSTIRYTLIEYQKKGRKNWQTVHHYWCYEWEDHVGPTDAGPIIKMYKMSLEKAEGSPILVHCSAGIGRTATFIGINYAAQKIQENSDARLLDVMIELRRLRHRSIQSQLQYAFLYLCILELFIERDSKFKDFRNRYAGITKKITSKIKEEQKKESKFVFPLPVLSRFSKTHRKVWN